MVDSIRALGVPSAGFHLDRWWGLGRQDQVFREPFFRYDYLFTADGGHDPMWEELGINHHWLPPGIYHAEAINGIAHGRYLSDIAFVGSWRSYGHPEWESHRMEMLRVLRQKFGSRFRCWPQHGGIRGKELASLYASTKIVIGDSCLAPNVYDQPIERYWSDRIPETTGRGGFLIHPEVAGLSEIHPSVVTYPLGNNEALVELISRYLSDADQRVQLRNLQAEETRSTNTYRDRIVQMLRDMGYAKGEAAEYCRENH